MAKLAFFWACMRFATPMQVVMILLLTIDAEAVTISVETLLVAFVYTLAQVY